MKNMQEIEDLGFVREVCVARENRAALGEPLPFNVPACDTGAASQSMANTHCYPALMGQTN